MRQTAVPSQTDEPGEGSVRVPPVLVEAPAIERVAPRRKKYSKAFEVRAWSTLILLLAGGLLAVGMMLHPSSKGVGTHSESLGLPPCGFLQVMGIPCATCGCTTAVSHVAHGNVWQGVKTQPFGAAVGVLAGALVVVSLAGLWTGKWYGPQPFWLAWHWRSIALGTTALLLAAWVYKIWIMR